MSVRSPYYQICCPCSCLSSVGDGFVMSISATQDSKRTNQPDVFYVFRFQLWEMRKLTISIINVVVVNNILSDDVFHHLQLSLATNSIAISYWVLNWYNMYCWQANWGDEDQNLTQIVSHILSQHSGHPGIYADTITIYVYNFLCQISTHTYLLSLW